MLFLNIVKIEGNCIIRTVTFGLHAEQAAMQTMYAQTFVGGSGKCCRSALGFRCINNDKFQCWLDAHIKFSSMYNLARPNMHFTKCSVFFCIFF